ncbi:aspartyl/asparaginyl beta-hydroxylase-like isoform X6 [Hemicordylus capensis]|uniref:aspartyl/asparaginyl beta-hydroxylase-like isoform X6 n=1 Tax=Hemicordylus capensis TaxID=884348 RepID=UPI0023027CDE|nr:aspartyl/asparaginyl beta-hydroxylase-like isoform X6 [Hemicordylus capensis]
MAPRKSPKSGSPGPGARRETKHGGNKNGKKEGLSGSSFFTWFMVIALLGVWTSVAVVWFELVDYEEVLGKLGIYDADGDGDFDVEDAKVLLVKWFHYSPLDYHGDGEPPGGVAKRKAKAKVKEIKEPIKKVKEKRELKKETKDEEKKKIKKKVDDLDRKDKKAADVNKAERESDKVKRDRKAEKERSGPEKSAKNKEVASGKDKEIKKINKNPSKASDGSAKEEEKRKKVK